jgi:hypothetical protein
MTILNTHEGGLSENQMLDRIKAARAEEPVEPTEPVADKAEEPEVPVEAVEAESEEYESHSEPPQEEVSDGEEPVYLIGDKEITLSRLIELEQGELRQADYTRKTQETAEQRKAKEAQKAKLDSMAAGLDEKIAALDVALNTEVESVNWDELAEDDPSEYLKRKNALEQKAKKLDAAREKQQELLNERASQEAQMLASKMPEWAQDSSTRDRDEKRALEYANSIGITNQDLAGVIDHRFYLMMMDAAKYRELKSKDSAVKNKVSKAPIVTPTQKGAPKKTSQVQDAKQRLRKTGSDGDAVSALKAYLKR